jgi:hypothetical protein
MSIHWLVLGKDGQQKESKEDEFVLHFYYESMGG